MDLGIKGRNAIICASSGGLGKASAAELVQAGVNVLICGRTAETLAGAAAELGALGGGAVESVLADVSTEAGQAAILSSAMDAFGHVDILVMNSGGPPPGPFEAHDLAAWDEAYKLLLRSTVSMVNGVLPGMKARGWGRIIGITSAAVKQPMDMLILSNSVRAGVSGLYKTLANEVGGHGITVNTVLPGYTNTDRMKNLMAASPAFGDKLKEVPLGRIGEPEEFGAAVAFLASARAGYITGAALPVDGGVCKGLL